MKAPFLEKRDGVFISFEPAAKTARYALDELEA